MIVFKQYIVALFVLPLLIGINLYADGVNIELDGNSLLSSVVLNYREMKTYEDRGYVVTEYSNGLNEKIEFSTYLSKPDKARIQWNKKRPMIKPRITILINNTCGAFTISNNGQITRHESLQSVLSAKSGISGTVTSTVPRLYWGHGASYSFRNIKLVSVIKRERIDRQEMVVVRVKLASDMHEDLWIDTKRLVIRKIEKSRTIENKQSKNILVNETINFTKVLYNHEIDHELFGGEIENCDINDE